MKNKMDYSKRYEVYRRTIRCKICGYKAYRKELCRICYRIEHKNQFRCTHINCCSPIFAATVCQKHYRQIYTKCMLCDGHIFARHLCRYHYNICKEEGFPEEPTCKECDKKEFVEGVCLHHFKEKYKMNECILVCCNNKLYKNGLCCKHYFQHRRHK